MIQQRSAWTSFALALFAATSVQAKTITWARYGDADSLDPNKTTTGLSAQVWTQVYDTLLAFQDDGSVRPNMAKSFTVSPDGTKVTLALQPGLKCHDGSDFDSADVKYTIDRALNPQSPSVMKSAWGPIEAVAAPAPDRVEISLSKPFAAFVPFLAHPFASMLCRSNAALNDAFGVKSAIGTGPWILDTWIKGDRMTFRRNPTYKNFGHPDSNKGAPYEDTLVIQTIPEAQTRLAALQTGTVDIIEPAIEDADTLKENAAVKLIAADNTGEVVFVEYATSRPPFNDVRARLAVAHAINAQQIVSIAYGDLVQPEACPVGRGVIGNDQAFCKESLPAYDPAEAKRLLTELGYTEAKPLSITIMTWTGDGRDKVMQIMQDQLKQVGILAKIEIMDIGTLNARVKQENEKKDGPGTFDLMGWNWYDADILYQLWHSPGAYHGFTSPELNKLLEDMRATIEPVKHLEIVRQVTRYLLANGVEIPVYAPGWSWLYATRAEIQGFRVNAYVNPSLLDVKIAP